MSDDEWELVDDRGFIYKRRKKRSASPTAILADGQNQNPSKHADRHTAKDLSMRQTMAKLLAERTMYASELSNWERILSKQEEALTCAHAPESSIHPEDSNTSLHSIEDVQLKEALQKLHVQVQMYERCIGQLETLLEQGKDMCVQLEEDTQRDRIRLHYDLLKKISAVTPRTAIHALTSESARHLATTDV